MKNGGCNKCGIEITGIKQRNNLNDFIVKAKKIYGDKYDYSKVEYVISSEKVIIICKKHGDFYVTPNHFISNNSECPNCALKKYLKQSINYLNFISSYLNIDIIHAENGGEYTIDKYKVDGFCSKTNTVYEYMVKNNKYSLFLPCQYFFNSK